MSADDQKEEGPAPERQRGAEDKQVKSDPLDTNPHDSRGQDHLRQE